MWLTRLLSVLTGVGPLLGEALKAYEAAKASEDHQAMALIQARVDALKGAYGLAATAAGQIIVLAFAFPIWVFFCKVVIFDKVLASLTHGSTDPVTGAVAGWIALILGFIFGHGLVDKIKN